MPTNLPAFSKKQNKNYYAYKHISREFIIFSKDKNKKINNFKRIDNLPSGWAWFESDKTGMILPKKG